MKYFYIVIAVFVVIRAEFIQVKVRSLVSSVEEMKALIPIEDIRKIAIECAYDPELVKLVGFLASEQTLQAVNVFVNNKDVIEFILWTNSKGVDTIELLNRIFALLGLQPINVNAATYSLLNCNGWIGFTNKIQQQVNIFEFRKHIKALWKNDKEFGEVMDKIQDAENILRDLFNHPKILDFIQQLDNHGVDTQAIGNDIFNFFGWST